MTINLPTLLVKIDVFFLTEGKEQGFINAYLVAARLIRSRPVLFTVHLENGGLYSNVPINAIYHPESTCNEEYSITQAQPWSCLESPANSLILNHLKDYNVKVNTPDIKTEGIYLFSIDYNGDGLAQDPEQHKMHHIIASKDGCLLALPNNYILFKDDYFTNENSLDVKLLKRQKTYYRSR